MKEHKKLTIHIPELEEVYENRYSKILNSPGFEKKLNILNCQTHLAIKVIELINRGYSVNAAYDKLEISFKHRQELITLIRPFIQLPPSYALLRKNIRATIQKGEYCHENVAVFSTLLKNDLNFLKVNYNTQLIKDRLKEGIKPKDICDMYNISLSVVYKVRNMMQKVSNPNNL